jgi:ketosteroid isomerase-like protein
MTLRCASDTLLASERGKERDAGACALGIGAGREICFSPWLPSMKTISAALFFLMSVTMAFAAADPATLKAELVRTEAEFFDYALEHGFSEAVHAFIADDGFVANSLTLGRAAQAERVKSEQANSPRRTEAIRWQPLHAEVAGSGELGYTWGVAESAPAKEGPFKPYGIYVTIWKRQPDGKWKFVYDSATILSAERIDAFVREHFPKAGAMAPATEGMRK